MIISIEDIYKAYIDCKKHKTSTNGFIEYQMNFILNNYQLYKDLNDMTYTIGPSKVFCVTKPKLREVFCAQFRDRIVHHLLVNKFLSIFESYMTPYAYACRKGKGVLYGITHLNELIQKISNNYTKETWILKCDLSGFFMNINRLLLFNIVNDVIRANYHKDDIEYWLWLWKSVIMNDPTKNCEKIGNLELFKLLPKDKSLFTNISGKGLPIGNLPSLVLANLLMSVFDKWIIKLIGDNGGYGRYVDDFVCISNNKELLLQLIPKIKNFLINLLDLKLHPNKIYLLECTKGVLIIGSIIKPNRIYLINRTINHLFQVIKLWNLLKNPNLELTKSFTSSCNSLLGLMIHKNTYGIRYKAWTLIKHKNLIYCVNMRKICINKKYFKL